MNSLEEFYVHSFSSDPDPVGNRYYYDRIFESIEKITSTDYDENVVSSHFYHLINLLERTSELKAFKQGIRLMFMLVSECLLAPVDDCFELRRDYERVVEPLYKKEG